MTTATTTGYTLCDCRRWIKVSDGTIPAHLVYQHGAEPTPCPKSDQPADPRHVVCHYTICDEGHCDDPRCTCSCRH